eukprot:CAMPEP_0171453056 /NCGR_PEP_ID=MMETSP0945-20130129/919_1 /TAXON_ID=109269 /ORGANISM="Vaucheria litorea, Strain CCMP2940" /LENGTH=436 /DNA_ID=CAMNT_0011977851 /DNA_START=32 /DNA_END=1342 /DNA_ORIENTATION=+
MGKGAESTQLSLPTQPAPKGARDQRICSNLSDLPLERLKMYAKEYGVEGAVSKEEIVEQLYPFAKGILHRFSPPKPLPLDKPKFSFADVRNSLPKHLFKRDLVRSLFHLAEDLILIAAFAYAASWISHELVPFWARCLLWPLYIFWQGTAFTGIWVLAHECGHQSFSESEAVNNFFGLILHSALLVPYHSWRISHSKHHSNTGSCDNDEVFVPATRSSLCREIAEESPLVQALFILIMLTVGWIPGYLCFNLTGPSKYNEQPRSHFNPWAKLFDEKDRVDVIVSDVGFFLALGGIVYASALVGLGNVALFYIAPYMVCNLYLVLITYLQHTDVFMPHFRGEEWSWFRGALCTTDRTFGCVIDHMIHHIADTHVCHHLFSKMPFYNAQEATEVLKVVLGDYYLSDSTPIPLALWRSYTCCAFIENEGNAVFYKSRTD